MKLLALAAACCAFAGERDAAIAAKMREMIAQNEVPGAVTVVATRDGISHLGVIGHADAGKTRPLGKDSIFWIASMTKPVTAMAVLMLQDEGKLSIDDPLAKYIPEFGANGVTLRHMLTHTSGMGESTTEEWASTKTLADMAPIYAKKPLGFTPGSQWKYCQSGLNMLGRVVEIVSGMTIEEFFAERIFKPLGMKDTTFYLSEKQMKRWVTPIRKDGEKLVEAPIGFLLGKSPTSRDRLPAPSGGLFSTGPDYARFARMLLRGGELDGKRYLSAASFGLMTTIQTGALKAGFYSGAWVGLGGRCGEGAAGADGDVESWNIRAWRRVWNGSVD